MLSFSPHLYTHTTFKEQRHRRERERELEKERGKFSFFSWLLGESFFLVFKPKKKKKLLLSESIKFRLLFAAFYSEEKDQKPTAGFLRSKSNIGHTHTPTGATGTT